MTDNISTEFKQENKYISRNMLENFDRCFTRFCHLHSWYKARDNIIPIIICPVNGREQEPTKNYFRPVEKGEVSWHFNINEDFHYEISDELSVILKKHKLNLTNIYFHRDLSYADFHSVEHLPGIKKHEENKYLAKLNAIDLLHDMSKANISIPTFVDYYGHLDPTQAFNNQKMIKENVERVFKS